MTTGPTGKSLKSFFFKLKYSLFTIVVLVSGVRYSDSVIHVCMYVCVYIYIYIYMLFQILFFKLIN